MKSFLFSLVMMISVSAFANPSGLQGTWRMDDRSCSDGAPPTDAFVKGRDTMMMEVGPQELSVTTVINGSTEVEKLAYAADAKYIHLKDATGAIASVRYLANSHMLVLFFEGFGEGGTCRPGTELSVVLTRLK